MIKSKLKEVMKAKGFTYARLEQEARISQQTINRARGELIRECRLSTLEAFAKAMGVSTKDLYEETADK